MVLTGGTRGLGFCMARRMLQMGDRVVLCGRDEERLEAAVKALGSEDVRGVVADVGTEHGAGLLEQEAREFLECTHMVVHNAGAASRRRLPLKDLAPDDIINTANVNVNGSLLVARMALRLFSDAPRTGARDYHYFSFGFSDAGAKLSASAITHKATKLMLPILDNLLLEELQKSDPDLAACVGVHQVSPGLLLTDLLLADTTPNVRALVFNALAEEPDDAAARLVPMLRSERSRSARLELLSLPEAALRMATTVPRVLLNDARAMRHFDRAGARVPRLPNASYRANGVARLFDGM